MCKKKYWCPLKYSRILRCLKYLLFYSWGTLPDYSYGVVYHLAPHNPSFLAERLYSPIDMTPMIQARAQFKGETQWHQQQGGVIFSVLIDIQASRTHSVNVVEIWKQRMEKNAISFSVQTDETLVGTIHTQYIIDHISWHGWNRGLIHAYL